MHRNTIDQDKMPLMSELVARRDVGIYTNGAISPKTMANLDSLGLGLQGVSVNGYIYYKKKEVDEFVRQRIGRPRGSQSRPRPEA